MAPPGEAPVVLLLDDDLSWLRAVRRLLTREGVTVLAFTDPAQLLAALGATQPALVVLDYVLPTTNGAEVARQIRARPEPAPPLALLSSSLGLLSDEERALFDAVVDKHEESAAVLEHLLMLTRPLVKGRTGTRMRAIRQQPAARRGRARH